MALPPADKMPVPGHESFSHRVSRRCVTPCRQGLCSQPTLAVSPRWGGEGKPAHRRGLTWKRHLPVSGTLH